MLKIVSDMPIYMGIDYGIERTGLAISDPDATLAFPLVTLTLAQCGSRIKLIEKLTEYAISNAVNAFVYGLPLFWDGSESEMCVLVRNFSERVKRRLDLPVYFESEFLTSEDAKKRLEESGIKKNQIKQKLDQAAACVILQQFLDRCDNIGKNIVY